MGCAAVLGALIAFPAGVLFSMRHSAQLETHDQRTTHAPVRSSTGGRKMYSPVVLNDPAVLQKHEEIVRALEISCSQTGQGCGEAKQARRYLDEREALSTP